MLKKNFIYLAILAILAISAVWCVVYDGGVRNGVHLYQLPLLCLVCFLLFGNIRKTLTSLSILTISAVCVIRYGIYPLVISIEGAIGSSYVVYSQDAFYLMLYEMVVVLFFINMYCRKLLKFPNVGKLRIIDYKLTRINKVFLFLTIPLAIIFPSLLGIFSFLGVAKSSVPISGIFAITFRIGVYIGYLFVLSKCSRNGKGGFLHLIAALTTTVLFIFMIAFGETNVSRWSFLWIGIPSLIIISSTFPRYKRTIALFACIAIPIAIIIGSFVKFAVSDYSAVSFLSNFMTSDLLSEYFGGLNGLTYSMQTVALEAKASTLYSNLTDLFCGTPLLSSFFDFENYSTQSIYLDYLGRHDLICPLLGQSYAHFGFWGAPIYSIFMAMFAIEFDCISRKAKDVYVKYISSSLCMSFSLFMCLNTIIILTNAWALIIFLIIQMYNKK